MLRSGFACESFWMDPVDFNCAMAADLGKIQMFRFFRSASSGAFKARALDRDADTDRAAVKSVADAINLVLDQAESERTGLKKRMDDVISRAALVGGNDTDEFLTRSKDRSEMLRNSDIDMKRGLERLSTIEQNISHFRFLRTALQSRFPDSRAAHDATRPPAVRD
jgi:hypothetical protein